MAYLLSLAPLLACPVGMGLMMWVMMRGNKGQAMGAARMPAQNAAARQTSAGLDPDERLAELRAQLGDVHAQQAAIAAQIRQLAAEDQPAEPVDAMDLPVRVNR